MDCWAIIPVKPLGAGKSRLAAVLGAEQRAALNKHLFGRVLQATLGVARHYGRLVDGWVIDEVDRALAPSIEALGCRVKVCNTIMSTLDEKAKLAQDAVELACEMAGEAVG